tara:strand:- start:184 stop:627 length:444 start_codon:yes stop_codon:yes gene_type:complete
MPKTVHPENFMFFREIASKRISATKAYEIYLERLKDPENELPKPPHHYKSKNSFMNSYYNARRDKMIYRFGPEEIRNRRQVCLGHAVTLLQKDISVLPISNLSNTTGLLIEIAEDLLNWVITGKNKDERDLFFKIDVKSKGVNNGKS